MIEITIIIAGIPWILVLVTSIITHEKGFKKTCYLIIGLDSVNLFEVGTKLIPVALYCPLQGFLIFLVIVAKKSVFLSLKEKARSLQTRNDNSSASNTKVGQEFMII